MRGRLEIFRPYFLVIGHVTKDLQEDGYTIGGTVTFASLTARNLGQRTAVVTRASPDLSLNPLYQGIEVLRLPSPVTTTFQNLYSDETRTQFLRAVAGQIKAADIPPAWREAKIVLLGPLADELEGSIVETFPHSLIGVTPQGWMRGWDGEGRVFPKPWEGVAEVLTCARVVVCSENDIERDENVIQAYARMADILVVTHGPGGATVYHRGDVRHFPAFETVEADPTGAGDVFAAAYLIELERSGDPYAAAHFANCVASFIVEKPGTEGIPTLEQVERRLAAGKSQ
ncbi:MAG: PfkB family carbohydrate kinase [Anaerolineae bacterium]